MIFNLNSTIKQSLKSFSNSNYFVHLNLLYKMLSASPKNQYFIKILQLVIIKYLLFPSNKYNQSKTKDLKKVKINNHCLLPVKLPRLIFVKIRKKKLSKLAIWIPLIFYFKNSTWIINYKKYKKHSNFLKACILRLKSCLGISIFLIKIW